MKMNTERAGAIRLFFDANVFLQEGENVAGQPKRFKKKDFENYVLEYFADIYEQQTEDGTTDIPTFYGFYRYVSQRRECSYHTVRRCFDEYWADIKKDFESIRADLLVRGGAMGRYHCTMVIFALKNWCRWADQPTDDGDGFSEEERRSLADALTAAETVWRDGDDETSTNGV